MLIRSLTGFILHYFTFLPSSRCIFPVFFYYYYLLAFFKIFCFVFQLGVKFSNAFFVHVYHISIYIALNPIFFPEIFIRGFPSLLSSWFAVNIFFSFCFLHFMADFNFLFLFFFRFFFCIFRLVRVYTSITLIPFSTASFGVCVCVFMSTPFQLSFVFRSA